MGTKKSTPPINVDFFEDLTGDIRKEAGYCEVEDVGLRIQTLRRKKRFSLERLSELTGLNVELLSNIETGKVCPQLGTAVKLSKTLDAALGTIVSTEGVKPYTVTRKNARKPIARSTSLDGRKKAYTYMHLAPEVKGRHMETLIVQLEDTPSQDISMHEGEEFIFVLEGKVWLNMGDEDFELEPGDSAYYMASTPHLISAKDGKATILAVIYEG